MTPTLSHLSEEQRNTIINNIITFFQQERDEEIGVIAAEAIVDFFLDDCGKILYNKAIDDALRSMKESFERIDVDVGSLKN